MKYQLIDYDVWGNAKDGYQVNDLYQTGIIIEISESTTDKQIKQALYKSGYYKRGICNTRLTIQGEPEFSFYVERERDLYPVCELRAIKD